MTATHVSNSSPAGHSDATAVSVPSQSFSAVCNTGDALGRLATSLRGGRGAVVGWTACPLCASSSRHSAKRFARGRGLAAHLHAVHTPWLPKKAPKVSQKQRLRQEQQQQKGGSVAAESTTTTSSSAGWDPTPAERQAWNASVLELLQCVEDTDASPPAPVTRTGQVATTYRASLPPFLQAAARGDLDTLQSMVAKVAAQTDQGSQLEKDYDEKRCQALLSLLDTRDRHGSMAEHWAAGEGHLECLQYLVQQRQQALLLQAKYIKQNNNTDTIQSEASFAEAPKKVRRRDGKTPLHYAARNGRLVCAQYLVSQQSSSSSSDVDAPSGDGTTPLHLACFGGHLDMARYLVESAGANVHATNTWQCTAAHWVAMCRHANEDRRDEIWKLCDWLCQEQGVKFHVAQSQGHSALHKAAQHQNMVVMKWMAQTLTKEEKQQAAQPDQGGHLPWDILQRVGGSDSVVQWLRDKFGTPHSILSPALETSTSDEATRDANSVDNSNG